MIYYLAVPYSHSNPDMMTRRFETACLVAARMMRDGLVPFSPLSHSVPVASYGGLHGTDHAFWMKQDLPILEVCDVLAVLKLPGWEKSQGVRAELEHARKLCMPIRFVEPSEYLTEEELAPLALDEA